MINNLFSIFDPSTTNFFLTNWIIVLMPLILMPTFFWYSYNRSYFIIFNIIFFISNEIKNNLSKLNLKNLILFISLFWFIILSNLLGLYPYIFTRTSHIIITMNLALPIWLTLILFGWLNLTNQIFFHLIPSGTPLSLSIFIVFIETISSVIRPITLSVRLTANIVAGHLLLSLLRDVRENFPIIYPPSSLILIALLCLEYAVAIIQSYVFITLFSLYLNEIN